MQTLNASLVSLLVISSSLTLLAQFPPYDPGQLEDLICKEQENASMHIHSRGERTVYADQTDVFYQEMHWEINPAQKYIKGSITYYFKSKVSNLTAFHLDMSNDLQVNTIMRKGNPLAYTHTGDQLLTISLNKTLTLGETDTLTISYEGIPPSSGFGSFVQTTHAGQPVIWTLSEPYGVRDWWPGKQDLIDKIDSVDIYITTPAGQLAASNGRLVGISDLGDQHVHHWQHRYPIASYLIAIAVTNYAAYSDFVHIENGDSIEILNYVYPESLTQVKVAAKTTLDLMELYNELFGLYPFSNEKYGHAQITLGGGMEHQTMSFMGNFGYELQAHELAHHWFGNKVTCGTWTDIWLNEGFATYLTGLAYERFSPELYWPLWKAGTRNNATSQDGGSVFVDDTTNVNRIFSSRLSYSKGAYLVHMLRWIIGDNAFFAACRDYLDAPETAYGFATTAQLQNHLEANAGRNLDEFFADWFYGQGFPSYQLRWTQQSDSLIIWLGQTQSHPSVSFFEMPVPVVAYIHGTPGTFIMDHQEKDQRFSFYVGDVTIDSLKLDPELWILSRNNAVSEITTAVHPSGSLDKFIVYPNPAYDYIDIILGDEVYTAMITNAFGVIINVPVNAGRLDVSAFASGFYTLILRNKNEEVLIIRSFVIQR